MPRRRPSNAVERPQSLPELPPINELEAAQEACRHAQEGNTKLARSVDALRQGLETIVIAEVDNKTGLPVTALELRKLAALTLDAYSALTGQSWRNPRNKIVTSRAGDLDLSTL